MAWVLLARGMWIESAAAEGVSDFPKLATSRLRLIWAALSSILSNSSARARSSQPSFWFPNLCPMCQAQWRYRSISFRMREDL